MEKFKALLRGRKKFLTIPTLALVGLIFLPITILLLLGWLIYAKVGNKKIKFAGLGIIGILVLFFGAAYVIAFTSPTPPKPSQEVKSEATQATTLSTPTPTPDPNLVKVTRVIDGDTIEIEGGKHVRFIGIDTPETVHPSKPVQCYGKEASAKTKELLEGQEIKLEKDVSEVDRYGRLLRYIWKGNTLVNELLVKEGYAQVSTYPPDVKYQDRFLAAQKDARDNNRGLWSACQTSTEVTQPASSPTVKPAVKSADTFYTPSPTVSSGSSGGSYTCNCSKTCGEMSSCAEAQYQLNVCGCTARDADHDGVACDSQCQ